MTISKEKFAIQSIGQIVVNVHKFEESVAFYRDVLELEFLGQTPQAPLMAFFNCDGTRIMLAVPTSDEFDHPASVIYYRVPDIHVAHQTLLEKGITFDQNPHSVGKLGDVETWMAFFRDPDNNTLAIMCDIPVEAA